MHDHDADSQPATELEGGVPGGAGVGTGGDETQADSQCATEPEGGVRVDPADLPATEPDTGADWQRATEPEADPGAGNGPAPAESSQEDAQLLELLARWEECYRRGEDISPGSLGVEDPALMQALENRIGRQKQLYAFMRLSAGPPGGGAEGPAEVPVPPEAGPSPPVRGDRDVGP